jgi:hypothetical protein
LREEHPTFPTIRVTTQGELKGKAQNHERRLKIRIRKEIVSLKCIGNGTASSELRLLGWDY